MTEGEAAVIAAKMRVAWDIFKLGDSEGFLESFPGETLTDKYVSIARVVTRIYNELPKFE